MNDCYYDQKDWRACKQEVREFARSEFLRRPRDYLAPYKMCFNCPEGITVAGLTNKNSVSRWKYLGNAGESTEMTKEQNPKIHEANT